MGCVQSQEPRTNTRTVVIVTQLEATRSMQDIVGKMVAQTGLSRSFVQSMHDLFFKICSDGKMEVHQFVAMFQAVHEQTDNEHLNKFLIRLYLLFDTDLNGHVDFEEFVTMLKVIIDGTMQERLAAIFTLCDTDKNGEIDRVEFLMTIQNLAAFIPGNVELNGLVLMAIADSAFDKMNITGSGAISSVEFIASLLLLDDDSILTIIRMLLSALTRVVTGTPPIPQTVHIIRLNIN